jgi:tripartite-type tricarboxylate transporter receptor subunit TctC
MPAPFAVRSLSHGTAAPSRRAVLATLVLAGALAAPAAAVAQAWPAKPVRMIAPFPAGGGYDLIARILAEKMSTSLGQPVVVENRAGANGNIGSDAVAKSAPDGYTLLLGGIGPQALSVGLYPKLPYDPTRDFEPISLVAAQPNLFVAHPSLGIRTVADLVQLAKTRAGQPIAYASTGSGSGQHLASEQLKQMAGIELLHVPYKGAAPSLAASLAGEVGVAFNVILLPLQHVKAGKLVALGIASSKRSPLAPDVPTLAEQGYPIDIDTWYGLLAPAGTPKDVVAKLHAETVRILALPDVRQRLGDQGIDAIGSTPQQLGEHIARESRKWTGVIRAAKITID